jgi:hypothetical protein
MILNSKQIILVDCNIRDQLNTLALVRTSLLLKPEPLCLRIQKVDQVGGNIKTISFWEEILQS